MHLCCLHKCVGVLVLLPRASHLPSQKLTHISQLAADKAHPALSLIGYPHEVACAMAYVFGDTIVCADAQMANVVTFGAKVCSVTLTGDQYDPSGTLSSGAAPRARGTERHVDPIDAYTLPNKEVVSFPTPSCPR